MFAERLPAAGSESPAAREVGDKKKKKQDKTPPRRLLGVQLADLTRSSMGTMKRGRGGGGKRRWWC
jgi:hypothetical protein